MEDNIVKVEKRVGYGNVRYYPMNEVAEQFCKLLGRKTLDREILFQLKEMGYSIEQKPEEEL